MKTLATRMLAGVDDAAPEKHKLSVLTSKFDGAIKEFVKGMGANIGHGLKFGQTIFPDPEMTLRVLAHGSSDDVAALAGALRLIPKSIRWSRTETWNLDLAAGLLAETLTFAKANMASVDLPEETPAELSGTLADEDGEQSSIHAAVYAAELTSISAGDEE